MPIQVGDITVYNVKEISELLGITGGALRIGDTLWRYVEWSTLKG
jgi:hypothetical protein